jgi:hypothetical protein
MDENEALFAASVEAFFEVVLEQSIHQQSIQFFGIKQSFLFN